MQDLQTIQSKIDALKSEIMINECSNSVYARSGLYREHHIQLDALYAEKVKLQGVTA